MSRFIVRHTALPCNEHHQAARSRQSQLTKPAGSLGRLEELAIRLAALQRRHDPVVNNIQITIFAGDHGIATAGVSAFPQAVTAEMIRNFARGGAAISVLAQQLGANLEIVNTGTVNAIETLPAVLDQRIAAGTRNFIDAPAMTEDQLHAALLIGRQSIERALDRDMQLFIGGEMGIGNTTAATALACLLLDATPEQLAGRGTGIDEAGMQRKLTALRQALSLHHAARHDPWTALRCVGGFEIAALTGAYLAAAEHGLPVLVDGFITTAAALAATRINPDILPWLLFSHQSAESGQQQMLTAMDSRPLLDLGMRLGEGSGAAVAVPLLRLACALHNNMATFGEAGVSAGPD
ncbi:MAG: nicotinate-nucleotide--dimethylbenzimidazole phosphoribosyltransferase [Gammaproteobacteria bacterium]|nr:nicotinate-nucleotide--dimethylbenzimidazole phosphoribosyltransferase [Gammaproteobacteria bacterium]